MDWADFAAEINSEDRYHVRKAGKLETLTDSHIVLYRELRSKKAWLTSLHDLIDSSRKQRHLIAKEFSRGQVARWRSGQDPLSDKCLERIRNIPGIDASCLPGHNISDENWRQANVDTIIFIRSCRNPPATSPKTDLTINSLDLIVFIIEELPTLQRCKIRDEKLARIASSLSLPPGEQKCSISYLEQLLLEWLPYYMRYEDAMMCATVDAEKDNEL